MSGKFTLIQYWTGQNRCSNYLIISVPVSRLPELVYETKKDLQRSNLASTIVGHVGDGNFHALILFDRNRELEAVSSAVHRLVHRAIALDGTCLCFPRQ